MIYLRTTGGRHLIILEPENIERLQAGEPAITPHGDICIAYTPDAEWLTDQIVSRNAAKYPEVVEQALKESLKRSPINRRRDYHPLIDILKKPEES